VQRNEAIFGGQNTFERDVNAVEKLVQVGGLVQRVNDIRDDLTLGFHAVKIGNVQAVQKNPFYGGIRKAAAAGDFEPAPRTVAAPETATAGERRAILRGNLPQMSVNCSNIRGVDERVKTAATSSSGR